MSTEPIDLAGAKAPSHRLAPRAWVRENLFPNVRNGVLTVVSAAAIVWLLQRVLRFVFVSGQWEIVRRNLTSFMVGLFPRDELWRPWAAAGVLALSFGLRAGAAAANRARLAAETGASPAPSSPLLGIRRSWPILLLFVVLLGLADTYTPAALVSGGLALGAAAREAGRRLPHRYGRWTTVGAVVGFLLAIQVIIRFDGVGWDIWGGLLLTLFLAATGIVLSFPLGVLLALGRRSTFPAVRIVCVGYIELIRGVPLITLLFMGSFALGFVFPVGFKTPSLITRALIAIVLFTAAYVAEIVRGGLQSVPKGQLEAAYALGMSPPKALRLIILPQALRNVIPAIVGQFISLFKDTSLVEVIGLTELLGIARKVTAQPDFVGKGLDAETLFFASFIFWVGAYWMSRASQRLERRLGVGER